MSTSTLNNESTENARKYTRRSEEQWRELIANYDHIKAIVSSTILPRVVFMSGENASKETKPKIS